MAKNLAALTSRSIRFDNKKFQAKIYWVWGLQCVHTCVHACGLQFLRTFRLADVKSRVTDIFLDKHLSHHSFQNPMNSVAMIYNQAQQLKPQCYKGAMHKII